VFTARYGLNPYTTQICIIFKGLRIAPDVIMNGNVSTKFCISLGISFIACTSTLDRQEADASFCLSSQYVTFFKINIRLRRTYAEKRAKVFGHGHFSAYIIIQLQCATCFGLTIKSHLQAKLEHCLYSFSESKSI